MVTILYEDERIVVLGKPPGLLSVPGIGPDNQECLAGVVRQRRPGARIVHRLDRETSGVIVMALDADAHRELSRQFEARSVAKRYAAVVAGRVGPDAGTIDLPLRKDMDPPTPAPRHIVDHVHGRPALTRYAVRRRDADLRPPAAARGDAAHQASGDGAGDDVRGAVPVLGERSAISDQRSGRHQPSAISHQQDVHLRRGRFQGCRPVPSEARPQVLTKRVRGMDAAG